MIEREGLPIQLITKKLTEGHPNVLDVIRDGMVNGVVNTITGERTPLRDGFAIRRAAAEKGIPCFTSLDTIRAVVEALTGKKHLFNVQPVRDYLRRSGR
jgi:carbamoyl-phosphate synthase large subunit